MADGRRWRGESQKTRGECGEQERGHLTHMGSRKPEGGGGRKSWRERCCTIDGHGYSAAVLDKIVTASGECKSFAHAERQLEKPAQLRVSHSRVSLQLAMPAAPLLPSIHPSPGPAAKMPALQLLALRPVLSAFLIRLLTTPAELVQNMGAISPCLSVCVAEHRDMRHFGREGACEGCRAPSRGETGKARLPHADLSFSCYSVTR